MCDLEQRLERAAVELDKLIKTPAALPRTEVEIAEYYRLRGKAEGVRLALSYLREGSDKSWREER